MSERYSGLVFNQRGVAHRPICGFSALKNASGWQPQAWEPDRHGVAHPVRQDGGCKYVLSWIRPCRFCKPEEPLVP